MGSNKSHIKISPPVNSKSETSKDWLRKNTGNFFAANSGKDGVYLLSSAEETEDGVTKILTNIVTGGHWAGPSLHMPFGCCGLKGFTKVSDGTVITLSVKDNYNTRCVLGELCGGLFVDEDCRPEDVYILANTGIGKYSMISLLDGNRWKDSSQDKDEILRGFVALPAGSEVEITVGR